MKWPAAGGTVCSKHGGAAPQVKLQNKQRLALAEAARQLGGTKMTPVETTTALQHVLWLAYRDMAFWADAVNGLQRSEAESGGLVVRGAQGASMAHVYVQEYNHAQERVARFAKLALDAGIEERKVQLLEAQAKMVAEAGRRFLAKLAIAFSLNRKQVEQARQLFMDQLRVLESEEVNDPERLMELQG